MQERSVDTTYDRKVLTSVDLFAGAGGLTEGLREAGVVSLLGSDNWAPAVSTFRRNHLDVEMLDEDAQDLRPSDLIRDRVPDLLVGGPPCQGFSSAGSRGGDRDPRNSLVGVFALLAASIRPRFVIFENVEGFLTAGDGRFVENLLDPLIEAGYWISVEKLNVANFGVPQLRKRVIVMASLHADPEGMVPTHHAWSSPGAHKATEGKDLPVTPSVELALAGLGDVRESASTFPTEHVNGKISDLDKRRIRALLPGQTMRDLPPELHHESYARRANRRVADGMPTEKRGGAPAGLRRLVGSEPSRAITSAGPREFIHPLFDRPLTLRECARLQTFPDSYEFVGSSQEKRVLVGNAVPPLFAYALAIHASKHLVQYGEQAPVAPSGCLVRFSVTNATTMSPALKKVKDRVLSRYPSSSQGRFTRSSCASEPGSRSFQMT